MKGCISTVFNLVLFLLALIVAIAYYEESTAANQRPKDGPEIAKKDLPPPPEISKPVFSSEHKGVWPRLTEYFSTCHSYQKVISSKADHRTLRNDVLSILAPENEGPFNLGQVCDIYDYLNQWNYVSDPPGEEYFAEAQTSWKYRKGDCDDYAISFSAAVRAIGGYPFVVLAVGGGKGHAFPEICLGQTAYQAVQDYILQRYAIDGMHPSAFRRDPQGNMYLNLDAGRHPGHSRFSSEYEYRLNLVENECKYFERKTKRL